MFFISNLEVKCFPGYYKIPCPLKMKWKVPLKVWLEETGDICCIPSRLSCPRKERNSQPGEWLERNTEGAAGCARRGAVKWEMVVIAWCASVNSAVISHTTCCCDLPGAPRKAPSRLACVCTLMRSPGRLIGFRAGDESAPSPFSPLWRLSSRLEQTDSYLGLRCNSPLKWVLTTIPSRHLGPELTWENNLMMPPSDKRRTQRGLEMCAGGNGRSGYCLWGGFP